ncbi:MAG: glucosamine-6-phosphate deaminase [Anaerococcus sp.]|nr:glucosamine-6-phosphate deaminase [Anaerococcus sp.]
MKLIVCENYDEMSRKAADLVAEIIKENPKAKLGLATGSSPEGMYAELVNDYQEGKIDFAEVSSINLDEYVGIDPENPQSYQYFMNYHLFDKVNIDKNNTNLPKEYENLNEATEKYNDLLDKFGTRDLQVLGIGPNGHIAFNEPADKLNMRTSIIDLSPETIKANSRFFDSEEDVPKQALSMGMADAFDAKTLLVLASGKAKHEAINKLVSTDKLDPQFPASFLALHNNCYLIVDKEAYEG